MNIDHKLSFLGHLWNAVPGADIESKVGFIASILGIISFLIWVYEHRRKGPVLSASQVSEIAATLAARLRNTAAPEGLVPKDAEELLLREAISDLQNIKSVSTKAAMAKLKDGDPKAAAAVFRETAMGLEFRENWLSRERRKTIGRQQRCPETKPTRQLQPMVGQQSLTQAMPRVGGA